MEPKNKGTEASRMRTLIVAALLLMSLLFVGTIQADTGAPESRVAGRAVAANATFDGAVDLVEEDVTTVVKNLTGEEGAFTVEATEAYNYTFNATGAGEAADLTYTDDYVTATITPTGTPIVTVTLDTDTIITAPSDVVLTIYVFNTMNMTNTTSQDITISVAAVNDMPTITAVADFDATQGTEVAVLLNGTDEETDWTANSPV